MTWTITGANDGLLDHVRRHTGRDVLTCYQCGKCTAGCPVAADADHGPRQIMHMVQLGDEDRVLRCSGIWLCVGCEACSTRCPRDVGPSHVIDALRHRSLALGVADEVAPTAETVPILHRAFLTSIRVGGRVWEVAMVALYKLRSLDLLSDTLLAVRMILNRKLKLLPPRRVRSGAAILARITKLRQDEADADEAAEGEETRS